RRPARGAGRRSGTERERPRPGSRADSRQLIDRRTFLTPGHVPGGHGRGQTLAVAGLDSRRASDGRLRPRGVPEPLRRQGARLAAAVAGLAVLAAEIDLPAVTRPPAAQAALELPYDLHAAPRIETPCRRLVVYQEPRIRR